MRNTVRMHRPRAALVALAGLGAALGAAASRVGDAPAPSATAVQTSAQQPAQAQADESASLRHGTITAIDRKARRIQIQGVWADVAAGKTMLLRQGTPAALDTLRVGEPIRFTAASTSASTAMLRVIYAP